jgi:hypothetical protein
MALSQSNLTIGIGIDTAKLRKDAALVKAELDRLTREVRAAARAGDVGRVTTGTQQIDALTRQYVRLNQQISANTRAFAENAVAAGKASGAYDELGRRVSLAHGKLLALTGAVAGVLGGIFKISSSAAESVDNFGDMTKALGVSAEEFGTIRQAMIQAGVPLDEINPLLLRFSALLGRAQDDLKKARGEVLGTSTDVAVLGRSIDKTAQAAQTFGDTGTILRGGVKPIEDTTNAFTKNNITLESSRGKFRSFTEQLIATLQALNKIPDASKRSAAAQELFSRGFTKLVDVPDQLAALQKQGFKPQVPSPAEQEAADKYIASWNQLLTTIERSKQIIGGSLGQALVPYFQQFNLTLQNNSSEINQWADNQAAALKRWVDGTAAEIEVFKQSWQSAQTWWENFNVGGQFSAKGRAGVNAPAGAGAAVNDLQQTFGGFATWLQQSFSSAVGAAFDGIMQKVSNLAAYFSGNFTANVGAVAKFFADIWQWSTDYVTGLWKGLSDFLDGVIAKAQDAWGWLSKIVGGSVRGSGQEAAGGVQAASGGYIRGPGSGTSDSILARLSNGEFVVNAGAVRRLGLGYLQALNHYATGGLVQAPLSFAEGGLVGGGGQAVASFHFESGNSYRLSGPSNLVGAMVKEANAQQMRSAGVKPSWYAGRPSGR